MPSYFVYILANRLSSVLYTGVTNDLIRRVYEHKQHFVDGFTKRYNVQRLVYFEELDDIETAITREKQIKAGLVARRWRSSMRLTRRGAISTEDIAG